ncbi:hypothetical protein KJA15_02375 [Patescibacteria group bacterium]|nr:hypothetical protein [Patescibacteria group bacterium]
MIESLAKNILVQYLTWHFFNQSKVILKVWKNLLLFNSNYFSIPLLIKTFFSHWRKYTWQYPRGLDIPKYLETFFSNLISRILGAIMRSALIFIGIFIEIFLIFFGAILFLLWLISPFLLIFGIYYGFKLLFL